MVDLIDYETQVRDFADRFRSPNVLKAVELAEQGLLSWESVHDLFSNVLLDLQEVDL